MKLDANVKITFGSVSWPSVEDSNNLAGTSRNVSALASPTTESLSSSEELVNNSDLINLDERQGEILAEIFSFIKIVQSSPADLAGADGFTPVQRRRRRSPPRAHPDPALIGHTPARQCYVHPQRFIRAGQRPHLHRSAPTSPPSSLPYGLRNAAQIYADQFPPLVRPQQARRTRRSATRHVINMVRLEDADNQPPATTTPDLADLRIDDSSKSATPRSEEEVPKDPAIQAALEAGSPGQLLAAIGYESPHRTESRGSMTTQISPMIVDANLEAPEARHNEGHPQQVDTSKVAAPHDPSDLEYPPGFEGTVFMVSADEPTQDNETPEMRREREGRNARRRVRREQERHDAQARADRDRRPQRNLADEFDLVGNRQVPKTPSANIAVAKSKLAALAATPEMQEVIDHLTAAAAQVDRMRQAPGASGSRGRLPREESAENNPSSHGPARSSNRSPNRSRRAPSPHRDCGNRSPGRYQRYQSPDRFRRNRSPNRYRGGHGRRDSYYEDGADQYRQAGRRYDDGRGHGLDMSGPKPFSERLRGVAWPPNFKIGDVKPYNGRTDPEQWIFLYETAVRAAGGNELVMANYLPVALGPTASQWLMRQPDGSIHSWPQLRQMMIDNFRPTCQQPGTKYSLAQIRDYPNEPLRDYIRRFSDVLTTVADITQREAAELFTKGLTQPHNEKCKIELLRAQPQTMAEVLRIAQEWILVDDALRPHKDGSSSRPGYRRDDDDRDRDQHQGGRGGDRRDDRRDNRRDGYRPGDGRDDQSQSRKRYRQDDNRRYRGNRVDNVKSYDKPYDEEYDKILNQDCPRHPNKGHTFKECWGFANIFTKVVAKRPRGGGQSRGGGSNRNRPRNNNSDKEVKDEKKDEDHVSEEDERPTYKEPERHVAAIFGGKVTLESQRDKKLLRRAIVAFSKADQETVTDVKLPRWSEQPISFSRADIWARGEDSGRFPLVLDPVIQNFRFEKVLIDGGSALNILFLQTYKELGLKPEDLEPYDAPFWGVMPGKPSMPLGRITLRVQFGTPQHFRTDFISFIVADFEGVYHAIIGRPGIARFMAVPHYGYMVLKMPTEKGVLSLRSNVLMAHTCETSAYAAADLADLRARMADMVLEAKTIPPADLEIPLQEAQRSSMKSKEHKKIHLVPGDKDKTALIGANLSAE